MSEPILPYPEITAIPNNEPVAAPALWNARYTEISQNFKALEDKVQQFEASNSERFDRAVLSYPDFDAASAAAATLPDGQYVVVNTDESIGGFRAAYTVNSGALAFVGNLDQLKLDLAKNDGAALVWFQKSVNSQARTVEGALKTLPFDVFDAGGNISAAAGMSNQVSVPSGEFSLVAGAVDLRRLHGAGTVSLSSGLKVVASALPERGDISQRYITEFKTPGNNRVTQSIAMHNGKLYRSQENTVSGNMYSYDTTTDVSEFDFEVRSRSSIDYTSDTTAQTPNYTVTVKGLGHGDGIAFFKDEGGVTWLYGHCSAPQGSSNPDAEANGFVKFPWLGAETALEPAGAVFYRNLQGVGNANFGLSADGKYLLFIQRDVDASGIATAGNGSVTTWRCVVHDRVAVETAADHNQVPPVAKFVVVPNELVDTIYAQSGITSDGKYIYITFSGARVVGKTFLYVYSLSGDLIKAITTSGIRAENVNVYEKGVDGWLPAFYETEGLTVHEDKLLTASRYLFTNSSPVVSWRGQNYVYIGTNPSAGNLPNDVSFWALTNAEATDGEYAAGRTYTRGTVVFHHYVTAYVTSGDYGAEEFSLDIDPFNHPYVENSFNGMVSSRTDFSVCYYPLNTKWVSPMVTFKTNGEAYFYDALSQTSGVHTPQMGGKLLYDGKSFRMQHISGLAGAAGLVCTDGKDDSEPNSVVAWVGGSTRGLRASLGRTTIYGEVVPDTNGTRSLGLSTRKWSEVFAATGLINTSDGTLKTQPDDIPDPWLDAVGEVAPKLWSFIESVAIKGDLARIHCGLIAQELRDAFVRHGVMEHGSTNSPFAGLCYDEWAGKPEVRDEHGGVVEPALLAGGVWGIRADQCLFLEAAYQRRERKRDRLEFAQFKKNVLRRLSELGG